MLIINRFLQKINPQNLMAALLILIIVGLLNIAALYASSEHGYRAGNVAMRRESQPLHYLVALDLSYQHGPHTVNWDKVNWS